jgi:hypothetical protein
MGTFFTRLRLVFHKVFFIINALFPPLREALFAGRSKLCRSVETHQWRCVSARCRPQKKGILGVHPSGGPKNGSRRVLNRDCRENEGEQSTPCCSCLPCAVWRCLAGVGLDSSPSLAEFVVLTYLLSAHIALNWLWLLSPRLALTTEVAAVAGRSLLGLSPMSLSPFLKRRTQHLTELMSMTSHHTRSSDGRL